MHVVSQRLAVSPVGFILCLATADARKSMCSTRVFPLAIFRRSDPTPIAESSSSSRKYSRLAEIMLFCDFV